MTAIMKAHYFQVLTKAPFTIFKLLIVLFTQLSVVLKLTDVKRYVEITWFIQT